MNKTRCPSCSSERTSSFFRVTDVPIDSCGLLEDQDEALQAPRGDLVLSLCKACGMVWNSAYDPELVDQSIVYEDQQCFSPTFNAFAEELVRRLIRDYDLHGKDILEIGCGKGDFLSLLCSIGENRGIGIDPAFVRRPLEKSENLTFIRDYFSEAYSEAVGEMVCCRHTLEHINETGQFVEVVRKSLGDRRPPVFFEVPDVTRILRDIAFWDIYYYHCSYFSPGSLARLFRSRGFKVTRLEVAFNDQYVLLDAIPSANSAGPVHGTEETPGEMARMAGGFSEAFTKKISHWQKDLEGLSDRGKRVVAWGSGSKCVTFLSMLGVEDELEYVVDINPYRQGRYLPGSGKLVVEPAFLAEYRPDVAIVMNPIYMGEIEEMTQEMGLKLKLLPV